MDTFDGAFRSSGRQLTTQQRKDVSLRRGSDGRKALSSSTSSSSSNRSKAARLPLSAVELNASGNINSAASEEDEEEAPKREKHPGERVDVRSSAANGEPEATNIPLALLSNFSETLYLDFGANNVVGRSTKAMSFALHADSASSKGYHSVEFERVPFQRGFQVDVTSQESLTHTNTVNKTNATYPAMSDARGSRKDGKDLDESVVSVASTSTLDANQPRSQPTVMCIPNGEKWTVHVTWTPPEVGGVREIIYLKLRRGRIRVTLEGSAKSLTPPTSKQVGRRRASVSAASSSAVTVRRTAEPRDETSPVPATRKTSQRVRLSVATTPAPSKSTLALKRAPAVRGSIAPARKQFTTPRTVYSQTSPASPVTSALLAKTQQLLDHRWVEKQSSAFTSWINYMFQLTEDEGMVTLRQDPNGMSSSSVDKAAFRTLLIHRQRSQQRQKALALFNSDGMKRARDAIDSEVRGGRLSIREDRDITLDVGLKRELMTILFSYSLEWLSLGLDTLFGLSLEATGDEGSRRTSLSPRSMLRKPTRAAIKETIELRILSDPGLVMTYTKGKYKTLSGSFGKRYKAHLRKHALKQLLILVVFLDRGRTEGLMPNLPQLFTKKSEIKSSRSVLIAVCREFLRGEGDISKHLSHIGVKVAYEQKAIDEFDYHVYDLDADLRDGVRLAKLVELITRKDDLMQRMRMPSVSRLQKVHNASVAFGALSSDRTPCVEDVLPHDVVDGNAPKVLKFLWFLISNFQLGALLKTEDVETEIARVHRLNRLRRHFRCQQTQKLPKTPPPTKKDDLQSLLLRWCQVVCTGFFVVVEDFSKSFADGKVMCLLISYYHPDLLRRDDILPSTADLESRRKDFSNQQHDNLDDGLMNEKTNWELARSRISEIGGIPGMLPTFVDSSNPPEEKSTVLCVAYLCSRLMESSQDTFAAGIIQNVYRHYRRRRLLQRKKAAATLIWHGLWCNYRVRHFESQRNRYLSSVRVIELFFLSIVQHRRRVRMEAELLERRALATLTLQSFFRASLCQMKVRRQKGFEHAVVALQSMFRGRIERSRFVEFRANCVAIQALYRRNLARTAYSAHLCAAIYLQSSWRRYACELMLRRRLWRIVRIQSTWRQKAASLEYSTAQNALCCIQRNVRRHLGLLRAESLRIKREERTSAAAIIQSLVRGYRQRQEYAKAVAGCVMIQSQLRCHRARATHRRLLRSAVKIQAQTRTFLASQHRVFALTQVLAIQKICRRWIVRRMVQQRKAAIAAIQQSTRQWMARKRANHLRLLRRRTVAAIKIQTQYRGYVTRREFALAISEYRAARTLQSHWRCHSALKQFLKVRALVLRVQGQVRHRRMMKLHHEEQVESATSLQRFVRGFIARRCRRRYLAARTLQTLSRMLLERNRFRTKREAATRIQAMVRRYVASASYFHAVAAATISQSMWRGRTARTFLKRNKQSALILQCYFRRQRAECIFYAMKAAALTLQRFQRGRHVRREIAATQDAARRIQTIWRCHMATKSFNVVRSATLLLQCFFRCTLAERKMDRKAKEKLTRLSAILIQNAYRKFVATATLQRSRASACVIQRTLRGHAARVQLVVHHFTATQLQRIWRGFQARTYFIAILRRIVVVQCLYRCLVAREKVEGIKHEQRLRENAVLIQCAYRRFSATTSLKKALTAVSTVQRNVRGYLTRVRITVHHYASTEIQKLWRGHQARKELSAAKLRIVQIQCLWRRHLSQQFVDQLKWERHLLVQATLIQSAYRRHIAEQTRRTALLAATTLQRYARGFLVRVRGEVITFAATELQKIWRRYLCRASFTSAVHATIQLQSFGRIVLAKNLLEGQIQIRHTVRCATTIQSCFRRHRAQLVLRKAKSASTVIQSATRGYLARLTLELLCLRVTMIQAQWRRYCAHRHFLRSRSVIISVQCLVRAKIAKEVLRERRLEAWLSNSEIRAKTRAARVVQALTRKFLLRRKQWACATMIQCIWRSRRSRMMAATMMHVIVTIQGIYRGQQVRKTRTKKVHMAALRIASANCKAKAEPHMVLGARTKAALSILLSSTRLAELMKAVSMLEVSTRLSKNCCIKFAQVEAPAILYGLVRTCNRSLPHVELLHLVLLTLKNVSEHSSLLPSIATPDSVDVLVDLMQMFRDKDAIFCVDVELLERIMVSGNEFELRCALPENVKRLKGILSISKKKHPVGTTPIRSTKSSGQPTRTARSSMSRPAPGRKSIVSSGRHHNNKAHGPSSLHHHNNPDQIDIPKAIRRLEHILTRIAK